MANRRDKRLMLFVASDVVAANVNIIILVVTSAVRKPIFIGKG